MQHVSTYNNHLQAMLIALQGGCAHLGSNMGSHMGTVLYSIIVVLKAKYSNKVNTQVHNGMTSFKENVMPVQM
jgi:hypothetical protein